MTAAIAGERRTSINKQIFGCDELSKNDCRIVYACVVNLEI